MSAPTGYIYGFNPSLNATDALRDLDVSAGYCHAANTAREIRLNAAITGKQTDAAWAAGSNAGGMDTGTSPVSNNLYIYAIRGNQVAPDIIFSTSVSAPTLTNAPGYTSYRLIGAVRTDASRNIIPFTMIDGVYYFTTPDFVTQTIGTTAATISLLVPTHPALEVLVDVAAVNASAWAAIVYTDSNPSTISIGTPSETVNPIANLRGAAAEPDTLRGWFHTNTGSGGNTRAITAKASVAGTAFKVSTLAYRINR